MAHFAPSLLFRPSMSANYCDQHVSLSLFVRSTRAQNMLRQAIGSSYSEFRGHIIAYSRPEGQSVLRARQFLRWRGFKTTIRYGRLTCVQKLTRWPT